MVDERPSSKEETTAGSASGLPSSASRPRFEPGEVLAGRFRIVTRLGRGGMGEVYRAEDLRLGQTVALKFLPPGFSSDPRMLERLITEVRIGRTVSHPNVCRLYDLVESDGQKFVAMEYIDGEDLASLLARVGRLTAETADALALDICSGLAAVHGLGVVHRDLKPANVMVDGRGRGRLTDFGLAVEGEQGGFAGTPAYMAPEVLAGQPATAASDVWGLGLVLWELYTGRQLVKGNDLRARHLPQALPNERPSKYAPEMDPAVEDAILRCLEREPGRRPAVVEVAEALPGSRGSAAVAPLAPLGPPARTPSSSGRLRPAPAASIAVLPFESLGGEEDDAFAVGLADEIIGDLGKVRTLRVISRGSTMRYRGARALSPVARELGVRYILTGSVRRMADQLRVAASLVDGNDETLVWSEKFRGTVHDVFDIQEGIARVIADQLQVELSDEEKERMAHRPVPDPVAYEYYLRAREQIGKFSEAGLERAVADIDRGIALVGDNVHLLTAKALALWQFFNTGIRPDDAYLDQAESLARRVASLDPGSYHADRILGHVAISRGEIRSAIVHLRRVVERDPNDSDARVWLTLICSLAGLGDLTRPLVERVTLIDPVGPFSVWAFVFPDWYSGRFDLAVEHARRGRMIAPDNPAVFFALWVLLMLARRSEEAAMVARLLPTIEDSFFGRLTRFLSHAVEGRREAAEPLAEMLEPSARKDLQYAYMLGEGWALLGERERALDWLELSVGRQFLAHEYLAEHSWFLDDLRGAARFRELLARVERERNALRARVTYGLPERGLLGASADGAR